MVLKVALYGKMPAQEKVSINEFDIHSLPQSFSAIMIGAPGSGKTELLFTLIYYLKHRYPVGRVFSGTDSGYKRFCDTFHPLFVSNYFSEDEEKQYVMRQRKCELENGKMYVGNYAYNILDDLADDPKIFRTPLLRGYFKLGSQHWNQAGIIASQYCFDVAPDCRKCVSYVFLFKEADEVERKKLHTSFGGICGSYETFCGLMDQITGDYTAMVIVKRTQATKMEDCVFYLRTQKLPPFRIGCKEMWAWAESRYDKSYKDEPPLY